MKGTSPDPALVHRVRAIVAAMEPTVREVFLLSHLADRRTDEIAEFLGISIEEVEDGLVAAIVHLARELGDDSSGST